VQHFDALKLKDVYAIISYYLGHREEVDAHSQEQAAAADELERDWTARSQDRREFKRLLLSRLAAKEQRDAASDQ